MLVNALPARVVSSSGVFRVFPASVCETHGDLCYRGALVFAQTGRSRGMAWTDRACRSGGRRGSLRFDKKPRRLQRCMRARASVFLSTLFCSGQISSFVGVDVAKDGHSLVGNSPIRTRALAHLLSRFWRLSRLRRIPRHLRRPTAKESPTRSFCPDSRPSENILTPMLATPLGFNALSISFRTTQPDRICPHIQTEPPPHFAISCHFFCAFEKKPCSPYLRQKPSTIIMIAIGLKGWSIC